MVSQTVTPAKTCCWRGFHTVVMLISFFTYNFHKNPSLVCWCAQQLHPSGNLFSCSDESVILLLHVSISRNQLTEIFSSSSPEKADLLAGTCSLVGWPELKLIMDNERKSSHEPFSHTQFHFEILHCCLSAIWSLAAIYL